MARSHAFSRARSSQGGARTHNKKGDMERILLWPVWEFYVRCEQEGKNEWERGLFWVKDGRARQSMIYLYSEALKVPFAQRLDKAHQ